MIIWIININLVYAKFKSIIELNYLTKIATPILVIESDEKKIIENVEEFSENSFSFTIKNYDDKNINQVELYYQFEIYGIEDINFELKNLSNNKVINFENNLSSEIKLGVEKEEIEYELFVDLSKIEKNYKIGLKVSTVS